MKYIILGNSDLQVSRLTLGCMSFGEADQGQYQWTIDYESSKEIIHAAYEKGINFFDTSNNYSNGTSEIFLGKAIKDFERTACTDSLCSRIQHSLACFPCTYSTGCLYLDIITDY